jgi:membrane dipeptidase
MLTDEFPGHVDIPRMRKGKVGGMFMSVWIPCEENVEFLNPDTVSLVGCRLSGLN